MKPRNVEGRIADLEQQLAEAKTLLRGRLGDVLGLVDVSCREIERVASRIVADGVQLEKVNRNPRLNDLGVRLVDRGGRILRAIHTPQLTQYRQENSHRQSVKQQGQQGERLGKARKALREADTLLAEDAPKSEIQAAIHRGLISSHDRPSGNHKSEPVPDTRAEG